jgi:hypothetical protein
VRDVQGTPADLAQIRKREQQPAVFTLR